MARLTRLTCLLAVLALAACFAGVVRELPMPKDGIVREKYARWGGLLRLWVCEGWESGNGSLSAWLNALSERFERGRDGVYVQATYVTLETLSAFSSFAENPPDMILFSPGALDSGADLIQTDLSACVRRELHGYADGYAVPVAMGGYAWAVNARFVPGGVPDGAVIAVMEAERARAWPLAALHLLTGVWEDETDAPKGARGGVELGLPVPETTPAPTALPARTRRPIQPADGSNARADAYQQFVGGDAGAMPVTQREIRRLQLLSDAGRGPDWTVSFTGRAFTDQLALIGIVDTHFTDSAERIQACEEFLRFALSEDGQKLLTKSRAFQVIDAPALYANQTGMAQLEAALMENELTVPGAFEKTDAVSASKQLARVFAGEMDASQAIAEMLTGA